MIDPAGMCVAAFLVFLQRYSRSPAISGNFFKYVNRCEWMEKDRDALRVTCHVSKPCHPVYQPLPVFFIRGGRVFHFPEHGTWNFGAIAAIPVIFFIY